MANKLGDVASCYIAHTVSKYWLTSSSEFTKIHTGELRAVVALHVCEGALLSEFPECLTFEILRDGYEIGRASFFVPVGKMEFIC